MDDMYFSPSVQRYHRALLEVAEAAKAVHDKTGYGANASLLLSAIRRQSGLTFKQLAEVTNIHSHEIANYCKIMSDTKFVRRRRGRTGKKEYKVYITDAGVRKHNQLMQNG